MQFFKPNNKFFEWVAEQDDSTIWVDVGCGEGHVVAELCARGHKAIGVEFRQEVVDPALRCSSNVYVLDVLQFPFLGPMTPLLCRPCHGPFPRLAMRHALSLIPEGFYVGLERNICRDLGVRHQPEVRDVGEDGEHIWRIERNAIL